MAKIKVEGKVVELDGDEMTRVIWKDIKDRLILPYLDVDLDYYDLGIENRDATDDQVTIDAAKAIQREHVGVGVPPPSLRTRPASRNSVSRRCGSPPTTIRNILGGTIFREPIVMSDVPRLVPGWTKPIVVARHAFGDQYKATDFKVPGAGRLTVTFTPRTAPSRLSTWSMTTARTAAWPRCSTTSTIRSAASLAPASTMA